jgi:IS30 family transposase
MWGVLEIFTPVALSKKESRRSKTAIADQKTEIGHWESDTMIGGNHLGVLVTYMDKASKFLVAGLAKNQTASEINPCHRKTFPRDSP